VWSGLGKHFVHYPLRGDSEVNIVAVTHASEPGEESWRSPGDKAALAEAFAGWPAPVVELVAAAEEIWRWPIYDRLPLAHWSVGRVTLLGDAAHPMPPYMAQGAAQAIEDAAVLAEQMAACGDVRRAFKQYEAERLERTAKVQAASRRNAALFHLPAAVSRPLFAAAGMTGLSELDWLYGGGPK
jgi:salicylate hydroxylase